jgi:hypothetical protein
MGKRRLPGCSRFAPKPGNLDEFRVKAAKMARFWVYGYVGRVIL